MPHELTRRAMYYLVWSKPMRKVAEDFGISDVALKKICKKHRVPTPSRGYWAKKESGQAVQPTRLHSTMAAQDELIVIRGVRNDVAPEVQQVIEQERQRRKERLVRPVPAAAPTTEDVHATVLPTAKALRRGKPDSKGLISASEQGQCGVIVAAASIERSVAIVDTIARGLQKRDLALVPTGKGMKVALGPDEVGFTLRERVDTHKHEPTVEELEKEERLRKRRERDSRFGIWHPYEPAYPQFDTVPTGQLLLEIENGYVANLRRSWKDGKVQRIEDVLEDFLAGVVAYLAGMKANREERERRHREWEERKRQQALAEARAAREKERWEFVSRLIGTAAEVDRLCQFLERLRSSSSSSTPGELKRMTDWCEERLAALRRAVDPDQISAALRERQLFPEIDQLSP